MGSSLARLSGFALLASVLALGSVASADVHDAKSMHARTTKFSFQHKRYMFSRQGPGSIAYLPASNGADSAEPLPVVVFLHGLNEAEKENPEFDGTSLDPRLVSDELVSSEKVRPFVLAAPTHSRYARGTRVMWHDFDLQAFLDSTELALSGRARIDRNNVVLVGHSGGGCNPNGGLLAPNVKLRAALAIDTCLDEKTMPALLSLAERTPVYFGYQRIVWQRPFDEFALACAGVHGSGGGACRAQEFTGFGRNPHREVLRAALSAFLPEVLPARPTPLQKAPSNVSLGASPALPPKA
ncbi:MAG: hypothetical protein U0174_13275 [Polyangiaceae bacterium]